MSSKSLCHQRIHLGLVANITAYLQFAQFLRQHLATRIINIHNHGFCAFGSKAADTSLANALRTASDDADSALVAKVDGGCG